MIFKETVRDVVINKGTEKRRNLRITEELRRLLFISSRMKTNDEFICNKRITC